MFEVKNENVHDKKCIRYIKKKSFLLTIIKNLTA